MAEPTSGQLIALGRYTLYGEIAAGGMATVYFGRLNGPAGFSRVVAIKRMHPHFACDPEFVTMFLDEAQLAARVSHPNVVSTIDVVTESGEIFIVMEYVRGESLGALLRMARKRGERIPVPVAVSIMIGVLAGLHAAHEARDERGDLLQIVHRDVSPQNVLVGQDGTARLVDFGVAKAASRLQVTRGDQLKGKVSYMAPEQLDATTKALDRGADLFAAGSVLWEMLAGRRLFQGEDAGRTIAQVLAAVVPPLHGVRDDVPPALEAVVQRALARDRAARYATADELAVALEHAHPAVASARVVAAWVKGLASDVLLQREAKLAEMESLGQLDAAQRRPTAAPPSAPIPPPTPSSSGSLPNPVHAVVSSVTPPPPSAVVSSPPSPEASTASVSMAIERPSRRNVVAASAALAIVLGIGLGAVLARRAARDRLDESTAAGPAAPAEPAQAAASVEPTSGREQATLAAAPPLDPPATTAGDARPSPPGDARPSSAATAQPVSASPSAAPSASARAHAAATATASSTPKKPEGPPKPGGDYLPDRP